MNMNLSWSDADVLYNPSSNTSFLMVFLNFAMWQTEIATMTAQVDFYEHQRAVLNADNNTIKQRIATLAQGQRFKDGM
jgi:hypothetical protein